MSWRTVTLLHYYGTYLASANLAADRHNPGALRGCHFLCSANTSSHRRFNQPTNKYVQVKQVFHIHDDMLFLRRTYKP